MLKEACLEISDKLVGWRRDFHQYPELSFEEKEHLRL
jgi:metal-dependent amidase/aminoacylase/carboxypeptidase family protein